MERLGRYEIVGELGRGAMGIVFRALDTTIGREVALKTIRIGEFSDPEQRARQRDRLFREARSAGVLSHPNIVTIYDIAEDGDVAYIAMEFVAGPTLERVLTTEGPLAPDRMFSILRQISKGLDYAHSKGIVHRDIKPANVMITEGGVVKITDFGIAKVAAVDQLTQSGLIMGTPNYMAPEQVQGRAVTGAADQYSLCVIAYEMLTGERPFVADQLPTMVYKIVCEEPPSPQRINPTLGSLIDDVLKRGLAKLPEERYSSCHDYLEALEGACQRTEGWKALARGGSHGLPTMTEEAAETMPLPADTPLTPPLPPPVAPSRFTAPPERRGSRLAAVFVVCLLLAGAAGGGYYYWQQFGTRLPWETAEYVPPALPQPAPPGAPDLPPAKPAPAPKTEGTQPAGTTGSPKEVKPEPPPAPKPAPPKKRSPAREPLPAAPVEVPVRTEPAGAKVVLDSGKECTSPCVLEIEPGTHTFTFSRAGYRTLTRTFEITEENPIVPVVTLAQVAGTVFVQSQPPGPRFGWMGNQRTKKTPARLVLPPGKYMIEVSRNGLTSRQDVDVNDGDLIRLTIALGR